MYSPRSVVGGGWVLCCLAWGKWLCEGIWVWMWMWTYGLWMGGAYCLFVVRSLCLCLGLGDPVPVPVHAANGYDDGRRVVLYCISSQPVVGVLFLGHWRLETVLC